VAPIVVGLTIGHGEFEHLLEDFISTCVIDRTTIQSSLFSLIGWLSQQSPLDSFFYGVLSLLFFFGMGALYDGKNILLHVVWGALVDLLTIMYTWPWASFPSPMSFLDTILWRSCGIWVHYSNYSCIFSSTCICFTVFWGSSCGGVLEAIIQEQDSLFKFVFASLFFKRNMWSCFGAYNDANELPIESLFAPCHAQVIFIDVGDHCIPYQLNIMQDYCNV